LSPADARRYSIAVALSIPLFVLACAFSVGGLVKDEWPGDVPHYQILGERMMNGEIPYHDFYSEYPPGALPTFVLPAAISENHYVGGFKWLMTIFGCVTLLAAAATLRLLRASTVQLALALGAIVAAPALLGHVFLNRYDPWPMALVSTALLLLLVPRARVAFALLAVAVTAKIYAVAALPVAAVRLARTERRAELIRALTTFLLTGLLVALPFAVLAFGGLGFSFYVQSTRPLQVESLGASILLAADQLGLYDARFFGGKANSIDLHGALPQVVGVLTSVLLVAAVLVVALVYHRGRESRAAFIAAFAASITAYVAFFKVISPQYMTWLVPLVPLVAGTRGRLATAGFLLALLATQIEIYGFEPIHSVAGTHFLAGNPEPWAPWVLLGRNLLLLSVFGLLLSQLRLLSSAPVTAARAARGAARGSCSDRTGARSPSSSAAAPSG
jgi:hypothetical protein